MKTSAPHGAGSVDTSPAARTAASEAGVLGGVDASTTTPAGIPTSYAARGAMRSHQRGSREGTGLTAGDVADAAGLLGLRED